MTPELKYQLRYQLGRPEPGEFSKDEVTPETGLTDALILFSLLYPPDGSFSMRFWTFDGRQPEQSGRAAELDDCELFKVWIMLASRLAASRTLERRRRAFALQVFEDFREALKGRAP